MVNFDLLIILHALLAATMTSILLVWWERLKFMNPQKSLTWDWIKMKFYILEVEGGVS